jgi:hypothetical protein
VKQIDLYRKWCPNPKNISREKNKKRHTMIDFKDKAAHKAAHKQHPHEEIFEF